jgi:hypothetical protein
MVRETSGKAGLNVSLDANATMRNGWDLVNVANLSKEIIPGATRVL